MNRSSIRYGVLSAVLLATAVPALAQPFGGDTPPAARGTEQGPGIGKGGSGRSSGQHPGMHGPHDPGMPVQRHDQRPRTPNPALDVAAMLAAAETYVGIAPDQEDAWRSYASALIATVDRPVPMDGPRGPGAPFEEGEDEQTAPSALVENPGDGDPRPLPIEKLAERAVDRGRKAQILQDAVGALRERLNADQLVRLAEAERAFVPPPRPHRGPHHDPRDQNRGEQPADPAAQPLAR